MCSNCGKKTTNPKFCSRSCSTSFSNRASPKRKWKCPRCGLRVRPSKCARYCSNCAYRSISNFGQDMTLGEARSRYLDKKASTSALVRLRARTLLLSLGRLVCEVCGYDKYVETAHRRAISSFSDDALLSEVNHPDNLMALCPNHHWEYDNLPPSDRSGSGVLSRD